MKLLQRRTQNPTPFRVSFRHQGAEGREAQKKAQQRRNDRRLQEVLRNLFSKAFLSTQLVVEPPTMACSLNIRKTCLEEGYKHL